MKTPMQEHIEWMQEKLHILVEYRNMDLANEVDECIQHAESMLKKEQAVIIESFHEGMRCHMFDPSTGIAEEYYNETFNTNQKNLPDSTNGYTYYPQERKIIFNTK